MCAVAGKGLCRSRDGVSCGREERLVIVKGYNASGESGTISVAGLG